MVVKVERRFTHPLFKKTVRRSKNITRMTRANAFKVGDVVRDRGMPPISKLKRWGVVDGVQGWQDSKRRGDESKIPRTSRRRSRSQTGAKWSNAMIQMQTNLDVADNSGARRVMCIKVLGGSKRRYATVGDVIVVSVKEAIPRGRVKKGDVHEGRRRAHREGHQRARTASAIRFDRNAAVLINNQSEPIGTRIFGPVPRELRAKNHMKIISLAPEVL